MNSYKKKILYHAISVYQLFEVMVHRNRYHKKDYAILLLPDFIVNKYQNWKELEIDGIFDEVHLFAYMQIPHNEETILSDIEEQYQYSLKYAIEEFSEIYVAGAHFYFSIYLIKHGISFVVFEDAAGMVGQEYRLRDNLQKTFPVHAKIIEKYGMFELKNECVKYVICNKSAKGIKYKRFNIRRQFKRLKKSDKEKIYKFFRISINKINVKNAVILLTQNFVGLGIMSEDEQYKIYMQLSKLLAKDKLYVKVHPDDEMEYRNVFINAEFLQQKVPIEILTFLFVGKPKKIITFSSTASLNFGKNVSILNFSKKYRKYYDFGNEFNSISAILEKCRF